MSSELSNDISLTCSEEASTVMKKPIKICVFGSSSPRTPQIFLDAAFELGQLIASHGHICVNGGGMYGCMGALSRGARSKNGKIIGVIHELFAVDCQEDVLIEHLIVSKGTDLNERKQLLFDNGDIFFVVPGGVGTLDELYDFLCAKSLKMKNLEGKHICVVNTNGFFDGTYAQMLRAEREELLYSNVEKYFHVVRTPLEAMQWCEQHVGTIAAQRNAVISNVSSDLDQSAPVYEQQTSAVGIDATAADSPTRLLRKRSTSPLLTADASPSCASSSSSCDWSFPLSPAATFTCGVVSGMLTLLVSSLLLFRLSKR